MKKESSLNLKGTAKTFIMPQLESEIDNELVKIVNFPKMVKAHETLQRRIKKVKVAGIYVEKQVISVDDVVYLVTPLTVAAIQTTHERVEPRTEQERKIKEDHIEKLKKSATFDVIYLSSDEAQSELEWFLGKFGQPKATASMKVEEPKKVDELSDEQKAEAKEMFTNGGATDAEIAEKLDVKKSLVTKFLKSLKNG